MDYNKFSKAELIDLLETSVSIDKYNKLEENLKLKQKALEEKQGIVDTLTEQIKTQEAVTKQRILEIDNSAVQKVQYFQNQFQDMKNHIDYASNMLNKEYQLATMVVDKLKQEHQSFYEFIDLYHEALFEKNKEEEKIQNTGGSE